MNMSKNDMANIERIKKSMNRSAILNELQRCVEKSFDKSEWDVWFRGTYLGTIKRNGNASYSVISCKGNHCGNVSNYMQALARYIDSTSVVLLKEEIAKLKSWVDEITKDPEIREWGLREPKTLWQKVKGWFK